MSAASDDLLGRLRQCADLGHRKRNEAFVRQVARACAAAGAPLAQATRTAARTPLADLVSAYRFLANEDASLAALRAARREAVGGAVPAPGLAREEVLALFGGAAAFHQAVQACSDEAGDLFADLRQGLFLGSVSAFERLCARREPRPGAKAPADVLASKATLAAALSEKARALGLGAEQVQALRRPVRGQERPLRDVLMDVLWQSGQWRLKEIGAAFGVGAAGIVNARARAHRYLARHRRLHQRLCRANESK